MFMFLNGFIKLKDILVYNLEVLKHILSTFGMGGVT